MSESRMYRPAGLLENYHIARQNLKLDSCVVVAAQFVWPSSSTSSSSEETQVQGLTKEMVYAAVVHALRKHAALSVRVVRSKSGGGKKSKEVFVYERLESINLEKVIQFLDDSESDEGVAAIIQNEFIQPIPSVPSFSSHDGPASHSEIVADVPLWRLTVTTSNVLLFAWHHCIGDGISGLVVLRTLLEGLNALPSLQTDFDPHSVKTPMDLTLIPPLEELTDLSVSFRTLFSTIAGLIVPTSWTSARKTWTGNPALSEGGKFSNRARLIFISPECVRRTLVESRKRGTTLTVVLYFLGVAALSKLVKNEKDRKYTRLSVSIPVALRGLAKIPLTAMAETAQSYRVLPRISSSPMILDRPFDWQAAATFSKRLRDAVPKTAEVIGLLKYLRGEYEGYFKGKLGKKRECSLEVSNLGSFKLNVQNDRSSSRSEDASTKASEKASEKWTISETYFAQDEGILGAALKMNVVGSPSGSVNISVTWGEGSVEDAFVESFVRELDAAIEKLDGELLKEAEGTA